MSLPNTFYTVKKNNRTLEIDVGNIPFERVNTNRGKSSPKRHGTSEGLKAFKKKKKVLIVFLSLDFHSPRTWELFSLFYRYGN